MDLYAAMRVFARIVEAGSFSDVARELNITQPTVSKQIAALEEHLGTRLVNRTTRSLTITDDGRLFYEHCRQILAALDEAEAAIGKGRSSPSGTIRLGCPVAFGRLHIAPRMARLLERYPELRIELVMSDGFVDLVEQGIDVAVRVGELVDQSLIARRIGTTARVTVGSPDYFAKRGEPQTPDDLRRHNCIVYTHLSTMNDWHFESADGPIRVRVQGNFRANNSEAVREVVLSGIGVAVTPTWLFRDEITRGLVKIVLRQYEPTRLPIHAVYPSRRLLSAKVRAVIDFLNHEFQIDPALSSYGDS
jgi:DNA-binding transcriptional LysR family regulator